jgi:large subunit ribosomal protein L29
MRAEKFREQDENELVSQEREMREQMFRLRFQMGMGQTDGLKKYRTLRKDRARILTILRQRQLSSDAGTQPGERK